MPSMIYDVASAVHRAKEMGLFECDDHCTLNLTWPLPLIGVQGANALQ